MAAKTAAKTKQKSTSSKLVEGAKAKTKAKAKDDLFIEVASEVENLTRAKAFTMVDQLVEDVEANHFRLGGILAVIQAKSSDDEEWLDKKTSFRELVQERFGLHYRKAMYLIEIYTNLVEKQIPWAAVKHLGWTKLKELARILTPKNVKGWADKAEKMTVIQLQEAVRKATAKGGSDAKEGGTSTVTTLTFKVHEDQKKNIRKALDKGKKEGKTEYDTVALDYIASAYLGNAISVNVKEIKPKGKKEQAEALKTLMTDMDSYEEVLKVFEKVYPDVELTVEEPE